MPPGGRAEKSLSKRRRTAFGLNTNPERESGSTVCFEDYRANESRTAPFEAGQTFLSVVDAFLGTGRNACPTAYAVNEVPQPQLPVAFGFVNVKPEPITPVT